MKATTVSTKAMEATPAKKKVATSTTKKTTVNNNRKAVTPVVKKTVQRKDFKKKTNYTTLVYKTITTYGLFALMVYCLANPIPGV